MLELFICSRRKGIEDLEIKAEVSDWISGKKVTGVNVCLYESGKDRQCDLADDNGSVSFSVSVDRSFRDLTKMYTLAGSLKQYYIPSVAADPYSGKTSMIIAYPSAWIKIDSTGFGRIQSLRFSMIAMDGSYEYPILPEEEDIF